MNIRYPIYEGVYRILTMKQGPFLLCLCHRGAFTGFLWIFLFAVPLSRKRKAVSDRPIHEWNKPSHTRQANREE